MAKKKKQATTEKKTIWHINEDGSVTPIIQQQQEDIAPVKNTWFKKGALDDSGYAYTGTVDKINRFNASLLMTAVDALGNVGLGITQPVEGMGDWVQNRVADVQETFGNVEGAEKTRRKAEKEWKVNKDLKQALASDNGMGIDDMSFLGAKGKSIPQGVGSVILAQGLGAVGQIVGGGGALLSGASNVQKIATTTGSVTSLGGMGLGSAGSSENEARIQMMSEMEEKGYTREQINNASRLYGTIAGAGETISEMMFGGLAKGSQVLGVGRGVFDSFDDAIASGLAEKINNRIVRNLVESGVKATSEGIEEVVSGIFNIVGKKLTYMKDEEIKKIIEDENLLDSFISGVVSAGLSQAPGLVNSITTRDITVDNNGNIKKGKLRLQTQQEVRDYITNLNAQEEKVVKQEIQDRLQQEDRVTSKRRQQIERQVVQDLEKGYISADKIEKILGKDYLASRDVRLNESFAERGRRTENYKVEDLSKYSKSEQKMIKKAMDSGLLNNSNRTHDFVDLLAKLASDKKMDFDFTNNERLAKSNFALKGRTIDGFVDGNKVTLNLESNKTLNKVVGHEITHILEGTDLYNSLQDSLKSFVGEREWNSRISELEERYKDVKNAKVENELTSDLVGEYIFNDESFVKSLSTKNPNLFQRIFDEIKYMLNIATAGSKEARELEKAKHTFEKLYRETSKTQTDTKYSINREDIIEDYSDEAKERMATNQNNVILNDINEIDSLVDDAYNHEGLDKIIHYGVLKQDVVDKIRNNIKNYPKNGWKFNQDNYELAIREDSFLHLNDNKAKITKEDVKEFAKKLPDIVANFDSVEYSNNGRNEGLRFTKTFDDGSYVSFTLTSDKKNRLLAKSISMDKDTYKKRSISPKANEKSLAKTSETNGASASYEGNISQNANNVKFSLSDNQGRQANLNDIKSKEEMDNVLSDFRNRIDNIKTGEDLKNTFRDVFNFYQQWDNNNYSYEIVEKDGLYGTKFESDNYKPNIKYRPLNEEIEIQKDNMNSWLNHLADNTDEIVYYNQDKVVPTIGKEINSLGEITPITTKEFQNELKDYINNETKDIKGKFESKDGHLYRGGNEVKFVYRAVNQDEMDSIIQNGYIKSNQSKNIGYEVEQGLTDFKDDYPGFYLPRNADGYILKVEVRPENGFFYDSDEYAKTPKSIPVDQIVEINGEKLNNIALVKKQYSLGEEYNTNNNSATFSRERIDNIISESISEWDDNYARAYVINITPDQFLGLTANEKTMDRLNDEIAPLDVDKLANERQNIFLDVNMETGKVTGHEGRHRMLALKNEGIKNVEIVVYPDSGTYDRYNAPRLNEMNLIGQDFSVGKGTDTKIGEMIPVSKANVDELRGRVTTDSNIQYSLSEESNLKTDSLGRQLSEQQQEFFKDSKVRDNEGRLMEVYHGTNADFTVFDKSYLGSASGDLGFLGDGFYFATHSGEANYYGGKNMAVYLDVKNPYNIRNLQDYKGMHLRGESSNPYIEIKNLVDMNHEWGEIKVSYGNTYQDIANATDRILNSIKVEDLGQTDEGYHQFKVNVGDKFDIVNTLNDYTIDEVTADAFYNEMRNEFGFINSSDVLQNIASESQMRNLRNETPIKTFSEVLQEQGYDGIMQGDVAEYTDEIVVFNPNQIKNVDNKAPTSNPDIRYSLSVEEANTTQDNEGRKLTDNQLTYFKDSKAVDDNGNLITVYHTMTDTGTQFNEFNPVGTEGYRFGDQVVNFYTNSQVMSDSYANYKSTKADTSKLSSIEDAKTWLTKQNTLFDEYNIEKSKGDGYYITSNGQAKQTLQFENKNDLLKNIKQRFYEYNKQFGSRKGQAKYQYEGYVNITNPYIIDAKEANWDNILTGYDDIAYRYAKEIDNNTKEQLIEMAKESERLAEESSNNWWEANRELSELKKDFIPIDKTIDELNKIKRGTDKVFKDKVDRAIELKQTIEKEQNSPYKYKDSYFKEHVQEIMNKLNKEQNMSYDENELYKMAIKEFVDESLIDTFGTTSSTNEIIKSVLNKNKLGENYDGVIIKNVMDYGADGAAFDVDGAAQDVYVTFDSNQFKSIDNTNPTSDADIRYSLSNQNEIAPTSDWNVRGQDIALQDAIAPIQEKLDQLSKTLDEVKLGMSSNEEFNLDDVTFDDDLANFNPEDINLAPFLEGTENTEDNRLLEGLEKAEDYKNKRKELKKQIEEKRSTYIAKDANKGRGWRSFLRLFENEFAPIDNLAKVRRNPSIKHKADTYNNWVALANSNMTNSQTDINGKPIGRSGNSIINQAQKLGLLDVLDTYVKHWSNIDRARQGKGGADFSSKESYKIVKQIEAEHPQIKKIASDVWNYFRNARHNLRDAGVINDDISKRLGRMYPHYVPYVSENVEQYFTENGELKPVKTIKRAKGGAVIGDLLSLQEAMQRYTYSEFKGIKFNELAKEIVKSSNENILFNIDDRVSYVDADQLYVDKDGYYLTAYENGEPISTKINQEIYDTLNRTLTNQVKDLEKQWSGITKPLQFLSKLKKNLVTKWSLTFPATNAIKDAGDAVFNSKYTKDYIKNYNPMSLYELATNQGDAPQFKNLYGVANDMGTYNIDSGLFEANKNAKNFNFLKGVENVNELIELLPRYAEYKASLDNGCSIEEAMYNAREVTTNFSRGGIITKALNRNGIPFLNPSVQGFSKFIRNFSGENGAKGIINSLAKATIFGIAPAIFNDLAFGSGDDKDEDYEALPDYIKDNYYLIKMSNGEFIRIPKGRMISIFGSASRRALEYMNGEEDAFDGFLKNIDSQIGINNPEENNLLAPILQAYGSKNGEAWYGGDIVPTRLQDVPEAEQYDASTDKLSIWLGEKTGLSPYKLNYILDQYSGGIGDIVLPMMTEETTNGAETVGDYLLAPISDKFIVNSTTDNKYVSDFYSTNEKLNTQANSMYATDEDVLKKDYMNSISRKMSQLYAERRAIQSDTTLSNKEKFAKSQAIKDEINKLAKEGIDGYENIDITGNYAEINDDVSYYKNANGKWTSIDEEDMLATAGLTGLQKSKYYDVKNDLYEVNKEYSEKYENATEAERSVLSTQKKQDTINIIKQSGLPDDVKANIYQKKYNDKLIDSLVDIGVDVNQYLDFKSQTFTADKNKNGKTISGSKKRKVFDYINQMNIPVAQKAILLKSQYNTFNTYNYEILEYIQKSNLSYDEKMELLKKIGFKIDGNQVSW